MKLVKFNNPVYRLNTVDRLFNDLFNSDLYFDRNGDNYSYSRPAVNWLEDEKGVEVEMSIPGYEKEQVKVSVEDDLLIVKGEAGKSEKEPKNGYVEFQKRSFEKKFRLSENLDPEKVNATVKNGVLKITISKKEIVAPNKREIAIA